MMIVDKILEWARGRGYTAVYGSAGQVNEMLTNVDFAASDDATAVIMHLVTDSATVDGKDTAVVAVYFASLCDLDFDGESLLPEQERLKGIGKDLLNSIRTGNEMTYKDPRWQYGYDDYAENVCWVCLRVTLTASAADCVPLSPEPPTPPPPTYQYNIFCPQFMWIGYAEFGQVSPMFKGNSYYVTVAVERTPALDYYTYVMLIGNQRPNNSVSERGTISEEWIQNRKTAMAGGAYPMTSETENWLRERIGKTFFNYRFNGLRIGHTTMLAAYNSSHYESKDITVI